MTEHPLHRLQNDPDLFCRAILGVKLWSKQVDIANAVRSNRRTAVQSGHNVGKDLRLDTIVPNASGKRTMGDLEVGDVVFDETGEPCNVTAVYDHADNRCFRITFANGVEVVAGEEHEWYCESASERRKVLRGKDQRPGKVRTTLEMFEGNVAPRRGANMWSVPVVSGPVQYPEADLPLDPYVFGVWLGDGSRRSGMITNIDEDVWSEIRGRGLELGPLCVRRQTRTVYGIITTLKKMGVERSKVVPLAYLTASATQRMDLLRGLLDTDGSCGKNGRIEFTSTDEHLAETVFSLASSLGFRPNKPRRNVSKLNGVRKKDRFRVTFMAGERCFNIRRKADRQKTPGPRCRHHIITSIVEVDSEPTRCITVDSPSHLFLCTAAHIPTHNSFVTACICLWFVSCFPKAVVLTTANNLMQVDTVLWKEIRRLHKNAIWPIGGSFKPRKSEFEIEYEKEIDGRIVYEKSKMFGFSPGNTDSVNGHHEDNLLIVFDEAQGLHDTMTWDAFSSMMTSSNAHQLVIGNPLYSYGPFRQCFRDDKWAKEQISCLEHPNYVQQKQIVEGALTYESIEEYRLDPIKGPGSEYWDTRIAGAFPLISGAAYMPEIFLHRCEEAKLDPDLALQGRYIGYDVSGFGNDKSVVVVIVDGVVAHFEALPRLSAQDQALAVRVIAAQHQVPEEHVNYDPHGGPGGDVTRAFESMGFNANPVGLSPDPVGDWDHYYPGERAAHLFMNRRTELHWVFRKVCEEGRLSIPSRAVRILEQESCELLYGFSPTSGMLYIEAKKRYKERKGGRSPDYNDAIVLAMARCFKPKDTSMGGAHRTPRDDYGKDSDDDFSGGW